MSDLVKRLDRYVDLIKAGVYQRMLHEEIDWEAILRIFQEAKARIEELEGAQGLLERRKDEDLNDWLNRIGAYK